MSNKKATKKTQKKRDPPIVPINGTKTNGKINGKAYTRYDDVLHFKYRGKKAVQKVYHGNFTRNEVYQIALAESKRYKQIKPNVQMLVTLLYPDQWRRGKFVPVGENPILYSYSDSDDRYSEDPNQYKGFVIYYTQLHNAPAGGFDKFNDCFWNCLNAVLGADNPWKYPENLKTHLSLTRDAMVEIAHIPKIEEKLKCHKITVTGDIEPYISKYPARNLEIRLKLYLNHFEVEPPTDRRRVKGVSLKERKPLIYERNAAADSYDTFDGTDYGSITIEEFKILQKFPRSSKHILIPCEQNKHRNALPMEDSYDNFVKNADAMKKLTKNFINMYKTGRYSNTAHWLFEEFAGAIHPQAITTEEAPWIMNSSIAALIYGEEYEGPVHRYDFCSMYPSIMSQKLNYFPIKQGELKVLTEIIFNNWGGCAFGIYRATVEGSQHKLFRFNKQPYYTHFDLKAANILGLKITLIKDGKPNFLEYTRDKLITGTQMFGKFVNYLFPLKKNEKVKDTVKLMLASLWGKLGETNTITERFDHDEENEILPDRVLEDMYPSGDGKGTIVSFVKASSVFESDFARAKPFVLARGRLLMVETFAPFTDHIVRIHTDGVVCTKKLPIKTGNELGELKFEFECPKTKVHNAMIVECLCGNHVKEKNDGKNIEKC